VTELINLEAAPNLPDLSVLIVDDNPVNRRILLDTVCAAGNLRPIAVESGRAAVETLEAAARDGQPFGLVLLDANHAGSSTAFDVAAEIARRPELARPTVMMLTSSG
jgi:CheY-like chemotaxis protein